MVATLLFNLIRLIEIDRIVGIMAHLVQHHPQWVKAGLVDVKFHELNLPAFEDSKLRSKFNIASKIDRYEWAMSIILDGWVIGSIFGTLGGDRALFGTLAMYIVSCIVGQILIYKRKKRAVELIERDDVSDIYCHAYARRKKELEHFGIFCLFAKLDKALTVWDKRSFSIMRVLNNKAQLVIVDSLQVASSALLMKNSTSRYARASVGIKVSAK
jgi:hypothetical protein